MSGNHSLPPLTSKDDISDERGLKSIDNQETSFVVPEDFKPYVDNGLQVSDETHRNSGSNFNDPSHLGVPSSPPKGSSSPRFSSQNLSSSATPRVLRFPAPSLSDINKNKNKGELVLSTTTAHGVYRSNSNSFSAKRMPSVNSANPTVNDNDSIYSEIASSFSNNFLFNFAKRENPLKSGGLGKEYWLQDSSATKCFLCEKNFNTFRRKHHCRICGQIFCSNCTLFISGEKFNFNGRMRVCKSCLSYADKYDDVASSDESILEGNNDGAELVYPTRSNETSSSSVHTSIRAGNYMDQDVVVQAPTPPPRMAIPATRHGAAVEIPSRNIGQRNNSQRLRRPRISQSSHHVRSGMVPKNQNSISDNSVSSNLETGGSHANNLRFLQQLTPTGFSSTPNIFTFGLQNHFNANVSPLTQESRNAKNASPSIKNMLLNHRSDQIEYPEDESEDEQSMSLYEALHDNNYKSSEVEPGFEGNFSRNFSSEPRGTDSKARLTRSNIQTRSERAQASLWRMKNRRRAKTTSKLSLGSQQPQFWGGLSRSNTVNFEDDTFTNMANSDKRNMFDFTDAESNSAFSAPGVTGSSSKVMDNKRVFSLPNKDLRVFMESHASQLLKQSLVDESLDEIPQWERTLFEILKQVSNINPNVRAGESFDIRQYVKLKRIPGALIENSTFVDGVVFSKNVALKSMAKELVNPQICLVMFPIEYTKSEQHFMSLELVLAQEKESLHKLVGRIIALNPDILFVGDSISGLALELLNDAGIVVVYNMKPQVIERISKLTDADVVTSIDKLAVNPKLGTCDMFEAKQYVYEGVKRSYIFLSGCDISNGGTILLRGANQQALKKVKNTVEFLVYVFFNLTLEYSLFRDEYLTVIDLDVEKRSELDHFNSSYYAEFIEKLRTRYLSSSSVIKFYMPPLLYKAREADDKLTRALEELSELKSTKHASDLSQESKEKDESENVTQNNQERMQQSDKFLDTDLEKSVDISKLNINNTNFKISEYILERKIESLKMSLLSWQRQWELFHRHSPYLLEPTSHQSLLFLYTMVNSKTTVPCVGPETLGIDYYWISDISLGQYIEHISLTANGACPEGCGNNLIDHYRSYVHGNGKVDVIVESFQSRIPGLQNVILMWNYCKECRQSTPVIPMSESTWKYSFGKFLELSFWSENVKLIGTCPHDFKNHIRYFGIYNLAVRMEYSKVETLELVVPKFKLHWKPDIDIKLKIESYDSVKRKSAAFFDSLWERLNRVKVDSMTIDKMEAGQKRIEELKEKAAREKRKVLENMIEIYDTTQVTQHLSLNSVIRNIQELAVEWDVEFQEFEINFLPSEKDISRITASQLRKLFMDKENTEEQKNIELNSLTNDDIADIEEKLSEKLDEVGHHGQENNTEYSNKQLLGANVSDKVSKMEAMLGDDHDSDHNEQRLELSPVKTKFQPSKIPVRSTSDKSGSKNTTFPKIPRLGTNELELELRKDNNNAERVNSNGKVKQLTSLFDQLHFDQISMEFEMQRERERRKLIANRYRAIPVIASKPIVEVYKNVHDAVEEELSDDESNAKSTKKKPSEEDKVEGTVAKRDDEKREDKKDDTDLKAGDKDLKKQTGMPQTERASLMKTLTSFWADRSAALWKPLAYPLSSTEHIFVDSDVIVREDEPSSLIAFCLSSSDYVSKLRTMRENLSSNNQVIDNSLVQKSSVMILEGDNSTTAESQIENSSELERIMLKKTAIHLKYQFQEGSSLLSCKIFFAEQFDAFRQECGIDDNFVQSLSRCIKWDSTGGKSGSAFLKTLDDRFVIKELSHTELDAFVKFAPSYFEYLAQALFHDLPTVLAKIFGFYQIHIKNPIDNKNMKMDLIIMENLFYDRKTSRIFDLKGSMRNRHVEQTGKENEVLLDENMVEYIYESPLFVKEYAKKLLRTSLWNDTLFLSRMNVMDYSLVIGIDSENHELVVGIIDCIRTFTWDKKLESWVKEKGLVGGGGKEPTVVTPRQYKNRFRDAMDRYILMVPDCWNQGPIE